MAISVGFSLFGFSGVIETGFRPDSILFLNSVWCLELLLATLSDEEAFKALTKDEFEDDCVSCVYL